MNLQAFSKRSLANQCFLGYFEAERFIFFMSDFYQLHFLSSDPLSVPLYLESSKSEVNRLLTLHYLSKGLIKANYYSQAADVIAFDKAINTMESHINIEDAGTAMRFLTAAFAFNRPKTLLYGSKRMEQRPIGTLISALQELGANLSYLGQKGYPPILIEKAKQDPNLTNSKPLIHILKTESSQFITALMLLGPFLAKGLTLQIPENLHSLSYVMHTQRLLQKVGVKVTILNNIIDLEPFTPSPITVQAESDWSSLGYWFSFVAQQKLNYRLTLKSFQKDSHQADSKILELAHFWGVKIRWQSDEITLIKSEESQLSTLKEIDFSQIPDQAQTLLPLWAVTANTPLKVRQLASLRIKETDRIKALQNELQKLGARFNYDDESDSGLLTPNFSKTEENPNINTYGDHRMALGYAVLSPTLPLIIENPQVVNKSYPKFWDHAQLLGIHFTSLKNRYNRLVS